MKEKLLTISISAYNAESYIANAIESCLFEETLDSIEVIVVDDGSEDRTGEIADDYSRRYPDCVKTIHKSNGGYGTAVNEGIKYANGRFFKLLDADDSFDSDGIITLINECRGTDVDVILTKVEKINKQTGKKKILGKWNAMYSKNSVEIDCIINEVITMHMLCIKTSILKDNEWFKLPSRIHYSDSLFSLHTLSLANKMTALNDVVYKYSIGIDGQSMSKDSLIRNVKEFEEILRMSINYYNDHISLSKREERFIKNEIRNLYNGTIDVLIHMKKSKDTLRKILELEKWINKENENLSKFICENSIKVRFLRDTHYYGYWIVGGYLINCINPLS